MHFDSGSVYLISLIPDTLLVCQLNSAVQDAVSGAPCLHWSASGSSTATGRTSRPTYACGASGTLWPPVNCPMAAAMEGQQNPLGLLTLWPLPHNLTALNVLKV